MRRLMTIFVLALVAALGAPLAGIAGAAHAADPTYVFSGTLNYTIDAHTVPLVAGDDVVARMTCDQDSGGGRPLDPYLFVTDPDGYQVAGSDDGFPPNCNAYSSSCVQFTAVKSGDYLFNAASAAGPVGPYTVSVYVNDQSIRCWPGVTSETTLTADVGEPFTYTATAANLDGSVEAGFQALDGGVLDIPGLATSGAVLSGTPTTAGFYDFLIKVESDGGTFNAYATLTVREKPAFTSEATATATYGDFVSFAFVASGYPVPSVSVDEAGLPAGLYAVDGTVEGYPAETGTFTITATAANGTTDATQQLTLTIDKAQFATAPAPVVTGLAKVGETLTAETGTVVPEPDDLAYQWLLDGSPIDGATESTYVPTAGDVDDSISVEVTATRAHYVDATVTSAEVGPVATDQAPDVSLSVDKGQLRRGGSTVLRWSTAHADTVTADGAWTGSRAAAGQLTIKPTTIGSNVYRVEATNENGTSVAQAVVAVRLPAAKIVVAAPTNAVAKTFVRVKARGFEAKESYRILVAGRVVATGKANAAGQVSRLVRAPAGAGKKVVRVTGSLADRTGRDVVQVRRAIAVTVAHPRIRASDRQTVAVRNLLPGQPIVVSADGRKVGTAKANRTGVAKVSFKVGQAWRTVPVVVKAPGQTAKASYQIYERCPGPRMICP